MLCIQLIDVFQETFDKNFPTEACQDCEPNDADNGSTMSTSSHFEPFATDDLGKDDVIYNIASIIPLCALQKCLQS